MELAVRLGLGGGISSLQTALARFPGAQFYARYDDEYGDGGLYYAGGAIESFTDVTSSPPAGEPTSAGMLVDGSDAPTLVQGRGADTNTSVIDLITGSWTALDGVVTADGSVGTQIVSFDLSEVYIPGVAYEVEIPNTMPAGSFFVDAGPGGGSQAGALGGGGVAVATLTPTSANQVVRVGRWSGGPSGTMGPITVRPLLPYLGYSGTEHTASISWDANSVTGDRVVWEARADANNRIVLHFVSGILRLESFVAGSSEGFVAVPGVDDGGSHSAVLYWDEVSGTISLDVDGQGLEGPELVTNGGFDDGLDDWTVLGEDGTHVLSVVAGGIQYQSDTTSPVLQLRQGGVLVSGHTYQIEVDTSAFVSGSLKTDPSIIVSTGVGTVTETFVASSNMLALYRNSTNVDLTISRVSVKATYTRTGLTLPTNLTEFMLGHSGGANQLNGYVLELAAADGEQAWT